MRKPEQSAEPSIEEILASIRRIIADDGGTASGVNSGMPRQTGDMQRMERAAAPRPAPSVPASYPSLGEAPEPRGDDDLLELTEDFLLEDAEPRMDATSEPEPQQPQQADPEPEHRAVMADDSFDPGVSKASFDEIGLQTVLSNVAAEVERLAAGDMRPMPNARLFGRRADAPSAPPALDRGEPQRVPPLPSEPIHHQEARASQPSQAARPKLHSRPVWSARRLDGKAPHPTAPDIEAQEDAPSPTFGGRDPWEAGVQMPVPDTGPEIPFPYALDEEPKRALDSRDVERAAPAADPFEGDADDAALESEKSFVGDFLSRVFGSAPSRDEEFHREEPTLDAPGLKGKAEKLAKATISDFASDKLKAPSVADALHADKPFMDQLTDSLESALAQVEAEQIDDAVPEIAEAVLAAGAAAVGDDLPEEPPLPEMDAPHIPPVHSQAAVHSAAFPAGPKPDTTPNPADAVRAPVMPGFPHPDPIFADHMPEHVPAPPAAQLPAGIEDSIKEMIKPLIMQWLNENLGRIVEQAVREELADRRPDLAAFRIGGNVKR
jgi:cell pole-organizing protein PopZ